MSVSLISCPKCNSWVLSDSAQCPHCSEAIEGGSPADATNQAIPENPLRESLEDQCKGCGVMVRRGVVRCWNCQAFMHAEIQEKYQQMQEGPRPVIYSQQLVKESKQQQPEKYKPQVVSPNQGEDDDFDLAPDVALYAEDDDFEMDDETKAAVRVAASRPAPPDEAPAKPQRPTAAAPIEEKSAEPEDSYELAAPVVESKPAPPAAASDRPKATENVPDVNHSVATGGEALWEIVQEEETSRAKSKSRKNVTVRPGSILVYCPLGHRIEVQERHRGKMGKCPKCRTQFAVPMLTPSSADSAKSGEATDAAPQSFPNHFADAHVHLVDPTKLKLKSGALAKQFTAFDLCLTREGLLLDTLTKKAGLFGGSKKPDDVRAELLAYLATDEKLKNAPGEDKHVFDPEELKTMKVVHPTAYAHESIFGGVNVFGPGIIAVRLPLRAEGKLEFLSLNLSQFRRFVEQLQTQCGLKLEFEEDQIPLKDKTTPGLCHYTDQPIRALEKLDFYQNDPAFTLELVGWKCQACGLTVSEDGRKKENIGGKNGRAIAKAKCPKCQNPFGSNPLYNLKQAEAPASEE